MDASRLAVARVTDDLRRLGVTAGASIMVHASMRAVGPVEGGAAGVVQALDEAVGPDGTTLMMIGARDDWSWVNARPEVDRAAALRGSPPFDPATAPADPENGVLAEIFRQQHGTLVSDHPEGRFAARGARARAFVEAVPWDDYYGPGSPLARLVDAGGHVLRLGADPNTVTLIHYAEYLADVPAKRRVRRHRLVAGPGGPAVLVVSCLDDADGIAAFPDVDYFGVILAAFLEQPGTRRGVVGRASSELIDAASLTRFAAAWMTAHLGAPRP